MKLAGFTQTSGTRVSIVVEKITGFCDCSKLGNPHGNTFISTGADEIDGAENGWYVAEKFDTVTAILQSI